MDLMELLPDYYQGNRTMEQLHSILTEKIQALANDLKKTIDQCFVNTATPFLSRLKKIYGLDIDISKSNEFRRERIRAKIRGVGTVTKEMIKAVARSYSNGEVEVIEDPVNYRFIIKFVGTLGIPANMADLELTIEDIKPAHLSVEYTFTYTTWGEIKSTTWGNLKNYTWDEIKTRRWL